jgi:hypothetical protein
VAAVVALVVEVLMVIITIMLEHLEVLAVPSLTSLDLFSGQCLPHGNLPLALPDSLLVVAVAVETNHHDQMVALVAVAVVTLAMAQANLV